MFAPDILHYAAFGGNGLVTCFLISKGVSLNATIQDGMTPLHIASQEGHSSVATILLKAGAEKAPLAGKHGTPLHQAALNGHVDTVNVLLENGCPLKVLSSDGRTALHFAAQNSKPEIVGLLARKGLDLNIRDESGVTPLHLAASEGKTSTALELINLGADKAVSVSTSGTPLHQAALNGHVDIVNVLLENGCPIKVLSSNGRTALHFAAQNSKPEIVGLLARKGLGLNIRDESGLTPLHLAASEGKTSIALELINLGADKAVSASTYGTPLHRAALNCHINTTFKLLEKECPLDVLTSDDCNVLHFAALGGNVVIVQRLCSQSLNLINAIDKNGQVPLHMAAATGMVPAAIELLERGANRDIVAGVYGTPLHQAAVMGNYDLVLKLIYRGCSSDSFSSYRASVLHFAAQGGNVSIIKLLSESGLNVNAVDNSGMTPLHWAARSGNRDAAVELLKYGANKTLSSSFGLPLNLALLAEGFMKSNLADSKSLITVLLNEGCRLCTSDDLGNTILHLAVITVAYDSSMYKAKVSLEQLYNVLEISNDLEGVFASLPCLKDIINSRNKFGQTPLMLAILCGSNEAAEWLVDHGADVHMRDEAHVTVYHYGLMNSRFDLQRFCTSLSTHGITQPSKDVASEGERIVYSSIMQNDSEAVDVDKLGNLNLPLPKVPFLLISSIFNFFSSFKAKFSDLESLRLPEDSKLNVLHVLIVFQYFLRIMINSSKSQVLTKLLSCAKLEYLLSEPLQNGMTALDLAKQLKLCDLASIIEGNGGRPGIWPHIPKHQLQSIQPVMPILFEAHQNLTTLKGSGSAGSLALDLLTRLVFQGHLEVPDENKKELEEYHLRKQVLNSKPIIRQVAKCVIHRLCDNTLKSLMTIGLSLGLCESELDTLTDSYSPHDSFTKLIDLWLWKDQDTRWSVLLKALGRYETACTISEIEHSLVAEHIASNPAPIMTEGYTIHMQEVCLYLQ